MTHAPATGAAAAALDGRVHHGVLSRIARDGHAPGAAELAAALDVPLAELEASLRRLHDGHGLVLHPGATDVWIAHPFSLSPTAIWVTSGARGWWAPCVWCATGIAALAGPGAPGAADVVIHARLGGEAEPVQIAVRGGEPVAPHDELLVHFAIPPRAAWNNVVHYCATVLPFRAAAEIDAWAARHRLPRGVAVPLRQVFALGRAWYGRHLDEAWRKWTITEARAIFGGVGLTGAFWELPAADGTF